MRSSAHVVSTLAMTLALVACAVNGDFEEVAFDSRESAPSTEPAEAAPAEASLECSPMDDRMPLEGRASPYDSTRFTVNGDEGLICYGRPSARGRTMIGGERVPYGRLWRTGANEPTILHLAFPAAVAGIEVEPGSYSLYTVPGPEEWTVIVNRSIDQWGAEGRYTDEVEAQEVGRAQVPAGTTEEHVETFTISAEPAGAGVTHLVLEWEGTRVEIPVERRGG
jgi:hypothetical protein